MIKVGKIAKFQSAKETIQTSVRNIQTYVYSNFVFAPSTFDLFNYGTPAPLSLPETCRCFPRNFIFDSHRDLKLSTIQENVKFKYFSRSMDNFQGLFKTNFVFKDFSRLPFIFKYFSSLCEPCVYKIFWGWEQTSRATVYWPKSPSHKEQRKKKGKSRYYYNANVYALEICI